MKNSLIPKDRVLTPHGLVHVDCIDEVKSGELMSTLCQSPPKDLNSLRAMSAGGWTESASFTPSEPLGEISAEFIVPDPPLNPDGSLIYLFSGAQDGQATMILQPVLQWGDNGRFGNSESWVLSCWHCTPLRFTRYSPPLNVRPGDTIRATVKTTECFTDSCDWIVEATVGNESTKLLVSKEKLLMLFVVAGALEAYDYETLKSPIDPDLYPKSGSTAFTDLRLRTLNGRSFRADWNGRWQTTIAGLSVDVALDLASVTLKYP
jgi:hypothetical protein